MEPTEALRSVETRLRLIIEETLGPDWTSQLRPNQLRRIESWRDNETTKRGTHASHESLINYTTTDDLPQIITTHWDKFSAVFHDRDEFNWLIKSITDVRNTIAHSRTLLPYERELLSGAAGKINQMIAEHRAASMKSNAFYPRIEKAQDNFGYDWLHHAEAFTAQDTLARLDVGTEISIQCSSTPVRDKELVWNFWARRGNVLASAEESEEPDRSLNGGNVVFTYTITPQDVDEKFSILIILRTDSEYVRNRGYFPATAHDDLVKAFYSVNPDD